MKLSIVVMSCDKYSDLWTPFAMNFKKYWSNCSFPVYLVTETLDSKLDIFERTILCGVDTEWTDRLDFALTQIDADHVILLCEDYLLCDDVDEEKILNLLQVAIKNNAGNLRMIPNPKPNQILTKEPGISIYEKGTAYRIATQAGIWQTEYLKKFSRMQTSIWGFERMGSEFSNSLEEPVLCTTTHTFPFVDAVHKGKWETNAVALCERNGIEIDFSSRSIMNNKSYIKKYGKGLILDFAPSMTNKIMNFSSRIKRVKQRYVSTK